VVVQLSTNNYGAVSKGVSTCGLKKVGYTWACEIFSTDLGGASDLCRLPSLPNVVKGQSCRCFGRPKVQKFQLWSFAPWLHDQGLRP